MYYILLILGFILLVKGADIFVDGSVTLAERFNVPSFIIGLTIVALGTSAPEAAVSITAALVGQNDIATGNVIGSNMFNTLIVLGVCSTIKPFKIEDIALKRDFPISIFATITMLLMSLDLFWSSSTLNQYSQFDGMLLLLFFIIYMVIITIPEIKQTTPAINGRCTPKPALAPAILKIMLGISGIIWGGKLVVFSCTFIAESFGVSSNLIGLTIVAIGTSLPELVTSIVAAIKGENEMAIGNVLGSNMFNILFVLGISSTIHPITINIVSIFDLLLLLVFSIITLIFFLTNKKLGRIEGITLIGFYTAYMCFIIQR